MKTKIIAGFLAFVMIATAFAVPLASSADAFEISDTLQSDAKAVSIEVNVSETETIEALSSLIPLLGGDFESFDVESILGYLKQVELSGKVAGAIKTIKETDSELDYEIGVSVPVEVKVKDNLTITNGDGKTYTFKCEGVEVKLTLSVYGIIETDKSASKEYGEEDNYYISGGSLKVSFDLDYDGAITIPFNDIASSMGVSAELLKPETKEVVLDATIDAGIIVGLMFNSYVETDDGEKEIELYNDVAATGYIKATWGVPENLVKWLEALMPQDSDATPIVDADTTPAVNPDTTADADADTTPAVDPEKYASLEAVIEFIKKGKFNYSLSKIDRDDVDETSVPGNIVKSLDKVVQATKTLISTSGEGKEILDAINKVYSTDEGKANAIINDARNSINGVIDKISTIECYITIYDPETNKVVSTLVTTYGKGVELDAAAKALTQKEGFIGWTEYDVLEDFGDIPGLGDAFDDGFVTLDAVYGSMAVVPVYAESFDVEVQEEIIDEDGKIVWSALPETNGPWFAVDNGDALWIFPSTAPAEEMPAPDLNVFLNSVINDAIINANKKYNLDDAIELKFEHSGQLPTGTSITVDLEGKFAPGTSLLIYHVEADNSLRLVSSNCVVDSNGCVTFAIAECSSYIVDANDISSSVFTKSEGSNNADNMMLYLVIAVVALLVIVAAFVVVKKKAA